MSTLYRSRAAIASIVVILTFSLSAPLTVTAQDQRFDGQVLAAQEQLPALAPDAGPSWEETSGYRSVEASRTTTTRQAVPAETVERLLGASTSCRPCREEILAALRTAGTTQGATTTPNPLSAALALGTRTETTHLATVPLPDGSMPATSDDRIANAVFSDQAPGDRPVPARRTQR